MASNSNQQGNNSAPSGDNPTTHSAHNALGMIQNALDVLSVSVSQQQAMSVVSNESQPSSSDGNCFEHELAERLSFRSMRMPDSKSFSERAMENQGNLLHSYSEWQNAPPPKKIVDLMQEHYSVATFVHINLPETSIFSIN